KPRASGLRTRSARPWTGARRSTPSTRSIVPLVPVVVALARVGARALGDLGGALRRKVSRPSRGLRLPLLRSLDNRDLHGLGALPLRLILERAPGHKANRFFGSQR